MNFDQLIKLTIDKTATDAHILITSESFSVRWRTHGIISNEEQYNGGQLLVNKIKIAAELNIAESRRIQEGQFNYTYNNLVYCIRVSIMRSEHGEKIALRILTPFIKRTLNELGLSNSEQLALNKALKSRTGLILVCGATGSGKTTTLYSCLQKLDDGSRTIFTIEDPVEQPMASLYQFEPNKALEITTHSLLKGLMRQDPDVIMVGEIRDSETADLAIAAALTGHLVLATLHTNSALNIVHRCQNWRVDFFALASTLKLIIHQSMIFKDNAQQPRFHILEPNWGNRLPHNYDELITNADLWRAVG